MAFSLAFHHKFSASTSNNKFFSIYIFYHISSDVPPGNTSPFSLHTFILFCHQAATTANVSRALPYHPLTHFWSGTPDHQVP